MAKSRSSPFPKMGCLLVGIITLGTLGYWLSGILYEANVRENRGRALSDMRSLSTMLDEYKVDYGVFPPGSGEEASIDTSPLLMPFSYWRGVIRPVDPKDYLADPFAGVFQRGRAMRYATANDQWIIWSMGPDRDSDLDGSWPAILAEDDPLDADLLHILRYDPTNGSISDGDLWRVSMHNRE